MENLHHQKSSDAEVLQYANLEVASMYQDMQSHSYQSLPPPQHMQSYPQFTPNIITPQVMQPTEEEMKKDKDDIYSHALFPLLSLAFEKCELATCAPRVSGGGVCSSESFTDDIDAFYKNVLAKSDKAVFTDNPELDNVMVQSTQVLRYHLLELEKVQELCDNFCSRYISCLKGKMPIDLGMEETEGVSGEGKGLSANKSPKREILDDQVQEQPTRRRNEGSYNRADDIRSRGTLVSSAPGRHVSNVVEAVADSGESQENSNGSAEGTDGEDEESRPASKRQQKRGIFPKGATNVMRAWLFQHLSHPYPSEDQKKQLSQETGLTILQVNNWFINARRRIVQPMIDQSNRGGNSQPSNDIRPKSTETYSYSPNTPSYSPYTHDTAMTYMDPTQMQMNRLPVMTGNELYDPMRGGYSYMPDTTPRYDMFGMQGVPRAEIYNQAMGGAYAQISPYAATVHPQSLMLPSQTHHMMLGHNPGPGNE